MTRSGDCKYRFGLTGTLDGTQTHRLVLEGLFGKVTQITTTKDLMDNKTLAKLNIDCIVLKHTEEECKRVRKYTYAEELNYIVSHKKRNRFIENLCKTIKGNTLVLFQLVDKHGVLLYNELKKLDKKVFFVYGKTTTETREKIRKIVEKEKRSLSLQVMALFLLALILGTLTMSCSLLPPRVECEFSNQSEEGLRQSETKTSVKLFDVSDNITYKSRQNFTYRHFNERLNIYKQENFNYEINRVKL